MFDLVSAAIERGTHDLCFRQEDSYWLVIDDT